MKDEHKANERQIMDSKVSFNTSTDSDNDCVFLFDPELNCIDISKAALQLFPGGTRKKDVMGKHLLDITPGLKETGRYGRYVEVLKTGVPISDAINVPGPKFSDVSLSAYIYPANDGLGITVNFSTDSGDLGQIVEAIREAEEWHSGLVEGKNDIVYLLDNKAIVTYISPIIESIVGYNASEIVGRNVSEYIYPEDLLLVIQRFQSGSFANIPGPFEFRLLTKSGEVRWVRNMPRTLIRKNRLIGYQGVLNDITDSKRAEEGLIRSGQQFQALIENASDAIVIVNADATIRYESPSMARITGRAVGDRIGGNPLDYCHPDDILTIMGAFVQLLEKKIAVAQVELRLQHKDGRWLTFEVIGTNLIDEPAVAGIVLNLRDISERKTDEERLSESEYKYRSLINSIADVIIEFDLDGKCMYCSPQIFDMIGYKPGEVIGWHVTESIHPEDITMVLEKMGEAYASGEILTTEFRLQHKDGHYCAVASRGGVVEQEGEKTKYVGSLRDVTQSKQLEDQYRTLVETMSDGLSTIDNKGVITYANKRLCEMTGYSADDLLGHPIFNLMDKATKTQFKEEMRKRRKGISFPYEMNLIKKDGSRLVVLVSPQALKDAEGNIVGSFGVITDITKAREAEEELRKSEQNLKLAQEIAHLGYWQWDIWTNEVALSEEMRRILEFNQDKAVFSGRPEIIHPDDLVKLQEAIAELQKGGNPQVEFRLIFPTGEMKWIQARSTNIDRELDGKGKIFGYALDITERKRVEEELQYSEQKMRNLFESVADGLCVIDLNGLYMDVNNKLLAMQGFSSREEALGKNAFDYVSPRDIERARVDTQSYLEQGSIGLLEYTNVRTDGSEYPVEITSTLLKDVSGNSIGFIASLRDITERKKSEEALRESKEKLRAVFDSIGEGVTVLDLAGNIVDVNETVLRIKGYKREDVIGRFGLDFVPEKDRARATEEMMVLFNGEVEQTPFREYVVLGKGGNEIPCEASASLLRDGTGNVMGLISVERDLRERKKIEHDLRESEASMQQAQRLAGIGSWTWNLKDNSFDFSEELSHLYGIEKKDIGSLEDILAKFIHPDDRETVFGAAEKVSNDGYGGSLVYRVIKPDGEIRWMNATIPEVRYFDVDGNPEVMVGAVQDITERKRDEQRLREREERWKIFSESATDVFTIWDSKLNLIDNSEKGINAFFPPETGKDDLIGKNITEFLPDEEREGRYSKYLNVIKTGKPYLVDDLVPHHRFGDRRVSIKAFKVGEGLGTIVTDITEHKKAEHQLKESEARLRAFMESSTDIYAIFDSQLRLTDISEKGVKAFLPDKTREEQIGKYITEIVPEVMETGRYEEFLKVIETGKPFSVEEAVIHPRYAIRHISIKAFKVQEGIGMIFSDITARKNVEQELRYYSERIRAMAKQLSEVEESQRRHIARELHDNVGQNLTVLGINFSRAKTQIARAKIEEVQSILDDSQQLLEQTTESIRNVMADLRPPVLEDYGLLAALRWYGNLFSSRNKISTTVQGEEPDPRMGIDIEIVLFRIAQEALTNIAKHAKASNVTMNFDIKDERQRLVITDDGVGFDTGELSKYKEQTSWGMVTMSERAQSIGSSLFIESHPGGGTKIVVEVPK